MKLVVVIFAISRVATHPWKSLEFFQFSRPWKVLENGFGAWKLWNL